MCRTASKPMGWLPAAALCATFGRISPARSTGPCGDHSKGVEQVLLYAHCSDHYGAGPPAGTLSVVTSMKQALLHARCSDDYEAGPAACTHGATATLTGLLV
jgi:hypothetical protein